MLVSSVILIPSPSCPADMIGSGNTHLDCVTGSFGCSLSAGMTQFFDMATFCWTATIATNMYIILSRQIGSKTLRFRSYEHWYHVGCWGFPLLTLLIATFTNSCGDAGNWCWIVKDRELERMLLYYVPLLCIMLYNITMYGMIRRRLGQLAQGADSIKQALNRRLTMYILVFIFIRIWAVINRFQNLVNPDSPVFVLYLLHSIFSPLQGFCNAFVYGFNKALVDEYRTRLGKWGCLCCGCCLSKARGGAAEYQASSGERSGQSEIVANAQTVSPAGSR